MDWWLTSRRERVCCNMLYWNKSLSRWIPPLAHILCVRTERVKKGKERPMWGVVVWCEVRNHWTLFREDQMRTTDPSRSRVWDSALMMTVIKMDRHSTLLFYGYNSEEPKDEEPNPPPNRFHLFQLFFKPFYNYLSVAVSLVGHIQRASFVWAWTWLTRLFYSFP